MFRWINSLRRSLQTKKPSRPRARRNSARLTFEALEERSLLANGLMLQAVAIAGTEDAIFNGVVAHVTDTNPATAYSGQIDWGDGSSRQSILVSNSGGSTTFDASASHLYTEEGSYSVSISLTNINDGAFDSTTDAATVADAALTGQGNSSPIVVNERTQFSGTLGTFRDANTGALTGDFSATIDWNDGTTTSGLISLLPSGAFQVKGTHTYAADGSYTISVKVLDTEGGSTVTFTSQANVQDVDGLVATAVAVSGTENVGFSGPVATFTDANSTGNAANYTATITWGDSQTSNADSITKNQDGSFTVKASHTYTDEGTIGFRVNVNKGNTAASSAAGTATIADAGLTPSNVTVTPAPIEQSSFTGLVATFTDADTAGVVGDFTATIDWGDGHSSKGTVSADPNPANGFDVTGTHTYDASGHFSITVQIKDDGGIQVTANSGIDVSDLPPVVTATDIAPTEGQSFSGTVASFTDDNDGLPASDYVVTIDWGDGHTGSGTAVANSSGGFDVNASHTYQVVGQYNFTVTVHSSTENNDGTSMAHANVGDAQLTANGVVLHELEQNSFTAVVATFTDANSFAQAGDFSATIDWGDQQTTAGSVTADPNGGFDVNGTHTYQLYGNYNLVITINDTVNGQSNGSSATANSSAVVDALPPVATGANINGVNGSLFSGKVATFTDPHPAAVASDFKATIVWGDGHTSNGTIAADPAGGFDVNGSNTYAAMGQYGVVVTITEIPTNKVATANSNATIVARVLVGQGVDVNVPHGEVATNVLVATFTDQSGPLPVVNYPTTIDWGDGSAKSAGFVTVAADGTFSVKGTHTFTSPGKYTIKTTIANTGGMTINVQSNAVVGSKNDRYVAAVYHDLLGRDADPGALTYWTNQLDNNLPRASFVLTVLGSTEYRRKVVDSLFQSLLGRPADPTGLAYFANFLASGTIDQVKVILLSSAEYYSRHGGNDSAWVTAVFNDILGRGPDPGGLAYFVQLLKTTPRATIAAVIVTSPEAYTRIVNNLYLAFVDRPADQAGLAFYVNALLSGRRLELVIADMVASQEYYNRVTA
jgi:PKD repeat protein